MNKFPWDFRVESDKCQLEGLGWWEANEKTEVFKMGLE